MKRYLIPLACTVALGLAACAQIAAFEKQASPVIVQACGQFRSAEANPLVQLALSVGGAATGTGAIVADVRSFGDAFCSAGPPPGDNTTPAQQAAWLMNVTAQMLAAANTMAH